MSERAPAALDFFTRWCMMREAIASCAIEGAHTDKTAVELVLIEDGYSEDEARRIARVFEAKLEGVADEETPEETPERPSP